MNSVAVVDYGMGNLRSVAKALEHVAQTGARIQVTSEPAAVLGADRVVFPGQGAARDCMRALNETGLADALRRAVETKPFLGICMGMQVLVEYSDENGGTRCLGIYPGNVRYFGDVLREAGRAQHLKIPHMGWNQIRQLRPHPLWEGIPQDGYFYFVHSYYVVPGDEGLSIGVTDYGIPFTSVIARDNVFAMQCHPEKSADNGLGLLANFIRWDGTV
jgi:glutamine amidotransferase